MNCTDAYREALTRHFSSTASSAPAPASTPAPSQSQAAEGVTGRPLRRRANPGQDGLESRGAAAAGAVTESCPAMALAEDAMVVDGEVVGQR
jgi:hypothetical protein